MSSNLGRGRVVGGGEDRSLTDDPSSPSKRSATRSRGSLNTFVRPTSKRMSPCLIRPVLSAPPPLTNDLTRAEPSKAIVSKVMPTPHRTCGSHVCTSAHSPSLASLSSYSG